MTRRSAVPGLRWRNGFAYYERQHPRLHGGRIFKALGVERLAEQRAVGYVAALNTLMERGDWGVLERWRRGDVDVTDIARAVREGEYHRLKRLSVEGTRLGEAVDRFLRRTRATRKPNTLRTYTVLCGLLVEHLGADYPMAELTVQAAEQWLHGPKQTAAGRPWSARSQANARQVYAGLWRMVIEQEDEAALATDSAPVVTRNPWRSASVPTQQKTRQVFLSPDRWHALITHPAIVGRPVAAFLGCACLAGLRQQEIVHLRTVEDVDLEAGALHVQNRKGRNAWTVKSPHSQRDVAIIPQLRELLEAHIRLGFSGERYFFRVWRRDEPISAVTAQDWTKAAFTAAGIQYGRKGDAYSLHSLRHTFGSWLAQDGVPFHAIAKLMGNTAQVVMQTYAHLAPSDLDRAMAVIAGKAS